MNGRVKQIRQSLHLSLGYVANYLKINTQELEQIEKNQRQATSEELEKLAELFQVSAVQLLDNAEIDTDQREINNLFRFREMVRGRI
jgi:predicted transcriptional regulator